MKINPFEFQYKIQDGETCFSYLEKFVEEIDKAAEKFLSQFEFVPSDDMAQDIWSRAIALYKNNDESFDNLPDWACDVLDCGVPYCGTNNGSLWYALGYSVISQDAHLRCFWENIKNDTNYILPFPVVVPMNIAEQQS